MKKLLELRQDKTTLKTQMRSIMDKATDEERNQLTARWYLTTSCATTS